MHLLFTAILLNISLGNITIECNLDSNQSNVELEGALSYSTYQEGYYYLKLFNLSSSESLKYWVRKEQIPRHEEKWWNGTEWIQSNSGSWCAEGFTSRLLKPGESVVLKIPNYGYQQFQIGIHCADEENTAMQTVWSPEISTN